MPEIVTFLAIAVTTLVAFDGLAVRFGRDSRPEIGDDHRR